MSPNVANTASNHLLTSTATGGFLTVISQNSSALTVIIVAITGAASIWLNHRNATANERRNKVNERDIKLGMIKSLEADGKFEESQLIRDTVVK